MIKYFTKNMEDITVTEVKERMDAGEELFIIDVREPHEWDQDHITDRNWPMGSVPAKVMGMEVEELKAFKEKELIINCRSGGRSGQITHYLRSQGFSNVRNLLGGMLAWKAEVDPNFNVQ